MFCIILEFLLLFFLAFEVHIVYNVILDLPAGETIRFLVGFTNKGEKTFTVQSLECSFRYPQDYNFFIQNVC